MMKAYKYIVSGVVQGVGFRYFAYTKAIRLGLKGYAKNMSNGNVEIYAFGEEDLLAIFKTSLGKGPSYSRVDNIETIEVNIDAGFDTFEVKY